MLRTLTASALLAGLLLAPWSARAHCDAIDGPVATAALAALDAGNVNLVLPYAPESAEAELIAVFEHARAVRVLGPEAQALADRQFVETAVRLHRAGEGAPYTGLQPAGADFGPAIPAAEQALATGDPRPLVALMSDAVHAGIAARFAEAMAVAHLPQSPATVAEVAAARERVSAEFAFVGYVESIHKAIDAEAGHHAH